jgi:hypothetical protein
MNVSGASGNYSTVAGANSRLLVEDGPQRLTDRIPDRVATQRNGLPRMGYQPLPADYAYQEYLLAKARQAVSGKTTALGWQIDILG